MNWFRNLKLFHKLLLAFSVTLFMIIVSNVFVIKELLLLSKSTKEISEDWLPSVKLAGEIHDLTTSLRKTEYKLVLTITANHSDTGIVYRETRKLISDINNTCNKYLKVVTSTNEDKLFSEYLIMQKQYLLYHDSIEKCCRLRQVDKAFDLLTGNTRNIYHKCDNKLDELIALNEAGADNANIQAKYIYERDFNLLIAFLIGSTITIIMLSIFVAQKISKPVVRLTNVSKLIADGNFDQVLRIESSDEIGNLSDSFNKMSKQVNYMFDQLNEANQALDEKVKMRTRELEKANYKLSQSFAEMQSLNEELVASEEALHQNLEYSSVINKKLEENQRFYSTLVNTSRDFIFIIDSNKKITFASLASENIFGYMNTEWIENQEILATIIHKDCQNNISAIFDDFILKNQIPSDIIECKWISKSGKIVYTENLFAIIEDEKNKKFLQIISHNITERKKNLDQIINLTMAVEQSANSIVITDINGNIEYVNRGFSKTTGYSFEEAMEKNPRILKTDHTKSEEYKELWEAISSGKEWRGEFLNKRKNGEHYWESANIAPIKDNNGKILRYIAIKEDITEWKKNEEQIKKLTTAVEQSGNSILIANKTGIIEWVNDKFVEVSGYTKEEITGKNPSVIKSGETPSDVYKEFWKTITAGNEWQGIFKNKKKNGDLFWEFETIAPVKNNDGEITHFIAIKEDITERRRLEEETRMLNIELQKQKNLLTNLNINLKSQVQEELQKNREKERMLLLQSRQAAMGEMIGNIAHQWRQPLNSLNLMVYDIYDSYVNNEFSKDYLNKRSSDMKRVIQHMSQTIEDFRNFFKPEKEKRPFNLVETVNKAVSFVIANCINRNIELTTEIDANINILGYTNEYAQVILNILNNAIDAHIDKNTKQAIIKISAVVNNNNVSLYINDNAGGIPKNIIDKIFDPYFTTKEEGKGTGVGLYMSKTIIEKNMDGHLRVCNKEMGAEFCIETIMIRDES